MLLVLLACTSSAPDDSEVADSTPSPWTDHYRADSVITGAGWEFEEEYLVRRMLDPGAGTIDEEFISTIDSTLVTVHFEVDVDAGTFALFFGDESYEGTGSFTAGEPWAWTGWTSHSVADDGSWVDSTDTRDKSTLHAEKSGHAADGEQEWTLVEDLELITEDQWTRARDAL